MFDANEELLHSKRIQSRERLPPLTTKQQSTRNRTHTETQNSLTSTVSETYLTSKQEYKGPRSPSNLSIHFNFDDLPDLKAIEAPYKEVEATDTSASIIKTRSHNSSTPKTNRRLNNVRLKKDAYHVLNYINPTPRMAVQNPSIRRGGKNAGRNEPLKEVQLVSNVKNTVSERNNRAEKKETSSSTLAFQQDSKNVRKMSTYNLHEFLSLPDDTELQPKEIAVSKASRTKTTSRNRLDKSKQLKDSTHNVFKFGAMSADMPKSFWPRYQRLQDTRPQMIDYESLKSKKLEKSKIPSVIIADLNSKNDSPREKQSTKKSPILKKKEYPKDMLSSLSDRQIMLEPPKKDLREQRNSVYNFREFLMLSDTGHHTSINKSSSLINQGFNSNVQSNAHERSELFPSLDLGNNTVEVNTPEERKRNLSVYDVYEFIKATSATELSACCASPKSQDKPSIIEVASLSAKPWSRDDTKGRENKKSYYDLREFLMSSMGGQENTPSSLQNRKNYAEQTRTVKTYHTSNSQFEESPYVHRKEILKQSID